MSSGRRGGTLGILRGSFVDYGGSGLLVLTATARSAKYISDKLWDDCYASTLSALIA
jgi:hypothetical protein